jgi:hypothetical protein
VTRPTDAGGPVLAIDPGREKCGLAVVHPDGRIAARAIVPAGEVAVTAAAWLTPMAGTVLLLGRGTGGEAVRRALVSAGLSPLPAAEAGTTLRARALYFRDHPPRGWRRLIPASLQLPPVPLDDYAAAQIALDYFRAQE